MSIDQQVTAQVLAAQDGDESAFAALVERFKPELQVHCYRMLGSLEDSEDLVQETFLRAWRKRASFSFEGRASFRAWLYRIATNACLDMLRTRPRRVLPSQLGPPRDPTLPGLAPAPDLPWLEPYPDALLDQIAAGTDDDPQAVVVARETIEIAFLATLQLLPPRQRAALIVRDVLGWSAKETAALLQTSVASANSALQRGRAALGEHLPARREDWAAATTPSAEENAVLERFMDAFERVDTDAIAALLAEDVKATMPPHPFWYEGRDANMTAMASGFDPDSPNYVGEWRAIATRANRLPAAAFYARAPGATEFVPFDLTVLRVVDGVVVEMTAFGPAFFAAFGLPASL